MKDIMKIVKSVKEFGLLLKGVSETIENKAKKPQKDGFLGMKCTLIASLLVNMSAGKGVIQASEKAPATSWGCGANIPEQLEVLRIFNAASSFN